MTIPIEEQRAIVAQALAERHSEIVEALFRIVLEGSCEIDGYVIRAVPAPTLSQSEFLAAVGEWGS